MSTENLALWQSVEKTNIEYTKHVSMRGGFTAIDPTYQMKTATEMFGSWGIGFGVRGEKYQMIEVGKTLCLYTAELWYVINGVTGVVPITSSIIVAASGSGLQEWSKMVSTNAVSKGLSKLGFNADVFLGKFDDNEYVKELRADKAVEKANEASEKEAAKPENAEASMKQLQAVETAISKSGTRKPAAMKAWEELKATGEVITVKTVDKWLKQLKGKA
tara:strand:+ start:1191 stop:1844 length:654 start_codon:yes stop_codon:yes gene_type:complete